MDKSYFNQNQIKNIQFQKQIHKQKIKITEAHVIYTVHKEKTYALHLSEFQLNQFKKDFDDDNISYDFSFWLRALFLFGYSYKNDIPE